MVGTLSVAATLALEQFGALTVWGEMERQTLDWRQVITSESFRRQDFGDRDSDVMLVLFDSFSVSQWPFTSPTPRAHIAEVIDALSSAGARTIGLNVYLAEMLDHPDFPQLREYDERLRIAIQDAGNVLLVGPIELTDSGPVTPRPHSYFADVSAGVGAAEVAESFETFRDGLLAVRSGGALAPSFALALYAHASGVERDSLLVAAWDAGALQLPRLPADVGRIPESWGYGDSPGSGWALPFTLRYYGPPSSADAAAPPGTFRTFSSSNVVTVARLMPEWFRDRVVLIGNGFQELDQYRTPFFGTLPTPEPEDPDSNTRPYGWTYGVEIHATALQNMLDGEYVRTASQE